MTEKEIHNLETGDIVCAHKGETHLPLKFLGWYDRGSYTTALCLLNGKQFFLNIEETQVFELKEEHMDEVYDYDS